MNHWIASDDASCTCLTRDSRMYGGEVFPHAARCDAAEAHDEVDHDDIRELAEIAANSDIDTAVGVYRAYLGRNGK